MLCCVLARRIDRLFAKYYFCDRINDDLCHLFDITNIYIFFFFYTLNYALCKPLYCFFFIKFNIFLEQRNVIYTTQRFFYFYFFWFLILIINNRIYNTFSPITTLRKRPEPPRALYLIYVLEYNYLNLINYLDLLFY